MASKVSQLSILAQPCNTAYYPAKSQFLATMSHAIEQWFGRFRINLQPSSVQQALCVLWAKHKKYVDTIQQPPFTRQDVVRARSLSDSLLLHVADHFPNTFFCYCPFFYQQLLLKTVTDPLVFQVLPSTASEVLVT
jgi:hypothetical protein